MTDRLKVGVAGGGLIAQVEHIPNLLALGHRFELKAVSDPSPMVRAALADRFGIAAVPEAADLLGLGLDALVIATPDPWHAELAGAAMKAGLHVLCEKPLCYGLAEIEALAAIRRRTGRVLQVGYMKRFDPSYQAALDLVAGRGARLRYLSVEVHDPDAGPFVGHHRLVAASDLPAELRAETDRRRRAQVEAALGFVPSETVFRGFTSAYCSALVHDVNAVHGLLAAMDLPTGPVLAATVFAGGAGGQAAVRLRDGQALWTMTHVEVPGVPDYTERIALHFDDEIVELVFPAPYLNHHPTRLTVRRGAAGGLETTTIRPNFEEAFVRELEGFWAAIATGAAPRNTIEEAGQDQALLIGLAQRADGRAGAG
ncbi:putative dehydrogenase [Inquilinus ginsengisoli]|uniref:Dehydrogenase n=1 Tax=Inquilinus ginsengisoli TaxID=363840 RepID=A0ABU1K113_9PROT|nr:Gfo/Idh/MocA family oxidoreductase [Inquilinus ginsengisoli]MDR6294560.1 putative dehydrogenase [Inquilinus ginsengisoli]